MKEYIIETEQASKNYGTVRAMDHVSVHVKRGEIYGLIGDNGAGKTTLLKALAGHIRLDGGEVRLFGKTGEKALERCRRLIGVMIEEPGYFPELSVEKNMEYYRIMKGIPGKERTEQTLRTVGLWEKRKSRCRELSMGMKQRLGLAIALIGEPQALLLDEPVNGLDPSGILELRELLHRLNREKNITILLSSHILSELQQTATVFGFLHRGKLIEEISAEALHEKCADYLEITVSDAAKYAALFDRSFPDENYKIFPGHVLRLWNPGRKTEEYSRLAAEHGILITGLERHSHTLEEYYMNLKGGARHA
ncbi:MAG TPA: ABC transporter ATP-binding protein [Candidatus Mediterraneibacter cottocaccae]|nr:ABC transporter ATP-binding protein [Candidatus Mediterraneibacter cottocaccae]